MTKTVFERTFLPASPAHIYETYLDAERHARVIGAAVTIRADEGAGFTAFDGHVRGRNLYLDPGNVIVQAWGSDHLGPRHLIVMALDPVDEGTEVSLLHTASPTTSSRSSTGRAGTGTGGERRSDRAAAGQDRGDRQRLPRCVLASITFQTTLVALVE